ncbi:hypothetical protein VZF83_13745 (plasmid) [Synechococcus elongatus IITB3]|uniref:hypothetical protein n=1 Tax=Synechococcus elongatus TaxID=32046 RepID=UPI0030D56014
MVFPSQKWSQWLTGTALMIRQFLSEKEWLPSLDILPELQPAIAGSGQWHSAAVPLSSTSSGTIAPQRERPAALATISAPEPAPEPLHQDSGTERAIAAGTERSLSVVPNRSGTAAQPVPALSGETSIAEQGISRSPHIETHSSSTPTHTKTVPVPPEQPFFSSSSRSSGLVQASGTDSGTLSGTTPSDTPERVENDDPVPAVPIALNPSSSDPELPQDSPELLTGTERLSPTSRPLPPPPWELEQRRYSAPQFSSGTERFSQPERFASASLHLVPERVSPTRLTPRMQQVYDLLDAARAEGLESYPELLAWVACHSGQRCSRRMVSAWKQDRFSRPVRSGAQ